MEKKVFVIIVSVIICISSIDSKVFAQNCSGGPDDGQGCTNGGDLRNGCNWICNNSAPPGLILKPPSCCEILAQTGDPSTCCFDARRRCTPQQCSSIPEGTLQQRCGQLWILGGYCNNPSPTSIPPTVTVKPTMTPQPTQEPIQSKSPNQFPTEVIPPKTIDVFESPTPIPVSLKIKFTLPSFQLNLTDLNSKTKKPLGFFEYLFKTIVSYDKKLEEWMNTRI